jgi:peptidoglycan/LPS O-acetylase OafA/YrhL
MAYIGALSYSLYLWQELFLDYEPTGLLVPFPLNLLAVAVTSLLSYYGVERVFLGLRHRFSR